MKTVLITGAASGIGLECAKQIVELGHEVICYDLKACPLKEVKSYIVDIRKGSEIKKATAELKHVDVLISCANVYNKAPINQVLNSDIDVLIDTNLKGNFLTLQAILPLLRKSAGNAVIVASGTGANVDPRLPICCATKEGLNMFVKCLANTEPQNGVRVNGIMVGAASALHNVAQSILFLTGLGGLDASCINGALLNVDGGESVSTALIKESKPNKN